MPTRTQVLQYLTQMRSATPADPITHTDVADYLESLINHLTNDGSWDPATVMTQVANLIATYPSRFSILSTTLYVDAASGNDNNTGTQASPLRTLTRVAAIANDKFKRVYIIIVGSYVHDVDVDFDVELLTISYTGTFLVKKRSFVEGEGTSFLRNLAGSITIIGSGTLTIEGHTGPAVGYTTSGAYQNRQGFLRGPLTDFASGQALLFVHVPSLAMGNNTVLFANYWGSVEALEMEIRTKLAMWGASTVTLGTNAIIGRLMSEFEFRKNILTTTGIWIDVLNREENILLSGFYAVQIIANTWPNGGDQFDMRWSGTFGWHAGTTNASNDASEIPLQFVGHARNGHTVQLRTLMTNSPPYTKLQISSNTLTSPATFIFRFRKLL
jgi:hypothetical protein